MIKLQYCKDNWGDSIQKSLDELECGYQFILCKISSKDDIQLISRILDKYVDDTPILIQDTSCVNPNIFISEIEVDIVLNILARTQL